MFRKLQKMRLRNSVFTVFLIGSMIPIALMAILFQFVTKWLQQNYQNEVSRELIQQLQKIDLLWLVCCFCLLTIFTIMMICLYRYFLFRIKNLKAEMHKVATGDFDIVSDLEYHDEISELYEDLDAMVASLKSLMGAVVEEKVQKEKLNSRQKDVEFKMLASQINPHFLYNTLETIRMKARVNKQAEIEELVVMLAKIMRRNIQVGDNLVTLRAEIELIEHYLKIQSYRFGNRIRYRIDIQTDISNVKVMPLIIQPIVENAYMHGLEAKEGIGELDISVVKSDRLRIVVKDNGVGMSAERLQEINRSLNDFEVLDKSHIGLGNVNQRIKLRYGDAYGIRIDSVENVGTTVVIELPERMN